MQAITFVVVLIYTVVYSIIYQVFQDNKRTRSGIEWNVKYVTHVRLRPLTSIFVSTCVQL